MVGFQKIPTLAGLKAQAHKQWCAIVLVVRLEAPRQWRDIVLAVILAGAAAFASYQGVGRFDPVIFDRDWDTDDVLFDSDSARVFVNMSNRWSNHFKTREHPLFSLLTFTPVKALHILGFEKIVAVKAVFAVVASLWISALFILLRIIGCRRFDAILFSVVGATSASAVFWFVVLETFPFSSLSILLALGTVALAQYRKPSELLYVVVSALTLSFTVTNWMAGIFATFASFQWRRALQITVNALCLVVVLWGIQKFIFPSAEFFIAPPHGSEFIVDPEGGGPLNVVRSFVFHTMVMPAIEELGGEWPLLKTQNSPAGSGSLWGTIAVGLWTVLLALGLWALFSVNQHLRLRVVLGFTLLGQLALHLFFGIETFLYSLHFVPLLVVLAALSTLTRARRVALVLGGVLAVCAGINNGLQLDKAAEFFEYYILPSQAVKGAMIQRPDDPWPRSSGSVVLAVSDTQDDKPFYYEPGGSFSPSVGSFGVSIWITDMHGALLTTSDSIPLNQIRQEFARTDAKDIPTIFTETIYYQTLWSSTGPGRWTLNLKTPANVRSKPMVVVRSVGPAGGPIWSLAWDGQRLLINERWVVRFDPLPAAVHLGEEGIEGWTTARANLTQWNGDHGWGYTRIELIDTHDWKVVIEDTAPHKDKFFRKWRLFNKLEEHREYLNKVRCQHLPTQCN